MKTSRFVFAFLFLSSGTALANPIMVVNKLSAEATGNTHVRLRYYRNYGAIEPDIATYGTSQSDWFTTGESTSADTGSGVQTMTYYYKCDCHVPINSPLTYQLNSSYVPQSDRTVTITPAPSTSTYCDAPCALADSRDAGAGGAIATGGNTVTGGNTATGGAGATGGNTAAGGTTVTGGAPVTGGNTAAGGTTPTGGAPATGGTTTASGSLAAGGASGSGGTLGSGGTSAISTTTPTSGKKSSGCSLVNGSGVGPFSILLAFGLAVLARRRRR